MGAIPGQFRLLFATPLPAGAPTGGIDITPGITALQYQTDVQGGFAALTVGLDLARGVGAPLRGVPRQMVDPLIEGLYHVQLFRGQQLLWEGRISRVDSLGNAIVGFQAKGYGNWSINDALFRASPDTPANNALVSSGTLLQQVLPTAAPLLSVGSGPQFTDPGVQHAPSEFDRKTAGQMVAQLVQEASTVGVLIDALVYENRVLQIVPRVPPDLQTAFPSYHLPLTADTPLSRIFDDVRGTTSVDYTDATTGQKAATPASATDGTFAARYPGLTRQTLIPGGTMTAAGAQAFALGEQQTNSRPAVACTVTRANDAGLPRWGGGEQFPELVRAGDWLQLGEPLDPGNPAYLPPLIIVRTAYDAGARTLTCELGTRGPTQANLLYELRRVAAAVKQGRNPNSAAAA